MKQKLIRQQSKKWVFCTCIIVATQDLGTAIIKCNITTQFYKMLQLDNMETQHFHFLLFYSNIYI